MASASHPCVLFALDREGAAFRRRCGPGRTCVGARAAFYPTANLTIVETGIGPECATRTLAWLAQQGAPSLLVMAGYAGGLSAKLAVGDVVAASEIVDLDNNAWKTTWPGIVPGGVQSVRLLTSPRLIGCPEEKRRLADAWQADAVDMEAAVVARFCAERNIPFGCVRALSDAAQHALSPQLVALLSGGQVSIARVLFALARRPRLLGELLTLARHTRLATERLTNVLAELLLRKAP